MSITTLALGLLLALGAVSRCGTANPFDDVTNGSPATAVAAGAELGNTFEGFGAANWPLGRYPGYRCAIAFIPRASKPLTGMWICWKTAKGYGAGTFGAWTFQLQADDPRGHQPSGRVLAQVDGVTQPPDGYLHLAVPPVALTAGAVYHLVTWNTDAAPGENWSSPNTIMSYPDRPWRGQGVMSFDGRGWREWGAKENRCAPYHGSRAAYLLEYADGTREGQPYYYAVAQRVYGAVRQGEAFTWHGPTLRIRQLGVPVFAVAPPSDNLLFALEETDGTALATGVLATPDGMTELPEWHRATLDVPVTLRQGHAYRLALRAPGCREDTAYAIFVLYATAAVPGWEAQTWNGGDGWYETGDGTRWAPAPVPADLSFSLIAE
jgi:hypothetical protein